MKLRLISAVAALLLLVGCATEITDNTVMFTAGEREITYQELEYYLEYISGYYYGDAGDGEAARQAAESSGQTLEEYYLDYAMGVAASHEALRQKAEQLGLGLTQEQLDYIEDSISDGKTAYGENEFLAMINESYGSMELYRYLMEIECLNENVFTFYYGEQGADLPDEELLAFCQDENYICLKLICRDSSDRQLMEELSERLKSGESFDTVMDGYSQYEAMTSAACPDGGVFTGDYFGSEVFWGWQALKPGEVSDVIEAADKLYIIQRLDIEPDMQNINGYSLRYSVAYSLFQKQLEEWGQEIKIKECKALGNINISEICGSGV